MEMKSQRVGLRLRREIRPRLSKDFGKLVSSLLFVNVALPSNVVETQQFRILGAAKPYPRVRSATNAGKEITQSSGPRRLGQRRKGAAWARPAAPDCRARAAQAADRSG